MILIILLIFSYFGSQIFGNPAYIGFLCYLVLTIAASYLRFKLGAENKTAYVISKLIRLLGLILAILGMIYIFKTLHHCPQVDRQCVLSIF